MAEVLLTDTNSHSLVNLDNVNQLLYRIWLHQEIHILPSLVQNILPIRVSKTQQLVDQLLLSHLFGRNHVTNSLINHQFLVVFKILAIFWNHCDQIDYVWLLIRFILLSEHVFGQLRNL